MRALVEVPVEAVRRFWSKVHVADDGCWLWTASTRAGYGQYSWTIDGQTYKVGAHQFSYELFNGPLGKLFVLHGCDTPLCVRPDHLGAGTHEENMAEMAERGRARQGMNRPTKLTVDEVREIRELAALPGTTQKQIADAFGIAQRTVSGIVRFELWRSVE